MTGNEIAERAYVLKKSLKKRSGDGSDGDLHLQLVTLIEALAKQVSTLDGSQTIQLQTTAEGETI